MNEGKTDAYMSMVEKEASRREKEDEEGAGEKKK